MKYPGLPVAVARAINTVVATQRITNAADRQGLIGSGVIMGDMRVITAAHNVRDGNGTVACQELSVESPGLLSGALASKDPVRYASSNKYRGDADAALLVVQASDNLQSLPRAVLAKRLPEVGDTVYFINFQPTADGKIRVPTNQVTADPGQDFSKPAVFSGIVISTGDEDVVVATGAGVNYGLGAPDTVVRKGASGGAVVNNQGELVGISVSSDSLQADRTSASIAKEYGRALPDHQYQIAHIQPVTDGMLQDLETSFTACD
jgi:S1-C subfamily serine protease